MRSGEDDDPDGWHKRAERFLKQEFPSAGRALAVLARHVEVKIAVRLLDMPPNDEVVVMDRKVCGRTPRTQLDPYTCDRYLPMLLRVGTSLTVVEENGVRVVYRGRRKQ